MERTLIIALLLITSYQIFHGKYLTFEGTIVCAFADARFIEIYINK